MTEREITLIKESSQEQELVITQETNFESIYDTGYSDGVEAGKPIGKKEQYDEFWDNYQDYGNRSEYSYGFYRANWNDISYNPKYPIIIQASDSTSNTFTYSTITDTRVDITIKSQTASFFYRCYELKTIRKLIVTENATLNNAFRDCSALENITVEGTIGANIDLSYSPLLTHASIMSVINHLKDYSGSGATYTLKLGTKNLAKLTDTEKAIATQKGWTLA